MMTMNQDYVSPFATSAYEEPTTIEDTVEQESAPYRSSQVGFKAPEPWAGMTEEQRRSEYDGFLYPSWYPFAALEGNYAKSPHFDTSHMKVPKKIQGEIDEKIEALKKQFAIPLLSKASYMRREPPGVLKRA